VPFVGLTRTKFGIYQTRLTLPESIVRQFPRVQREYRRSLKTSDRTAAKYRNAILQVRFHEGIQTILGRAPSMDADQVQILINTTLESIGMANIKTGYTFEFHGDGNLKKAETDGSQQDHENMVEAMKLHKESNQQTPTPQAPAPQNPTRSNYSKNLEKTFKQIADEYLSHHASKWAAGTIDQRKGEVARLCKALPETPLEGFTEGTTRSLIESLAMLPKRGAAGKECISGPTQGKYFEVYKDVIQLGLFGSDAEYILGKLEVKTDSESEPYQSFSDHELDIIFNGCVYTGQCFQYQSKKDYMFWLSLIGLFSGMRLNEICQLQLSDVKEFQGIYYLDNNLNFHDPNVPDKTLKGKGPNRAAIRLVPVHDELMKIGFVEFLQAPRSGVNAHMLFNKLKMSAKGKWYKEPSRSSGEYFEMLGIKTKHKVYHSFRHNFVTQLTLGNYSHNVVINDAGEKRKRIIGHALPDEVTQGYTHLGKLVVPILKEVIDLVKYDIDLSHLYQK
jgi:hypothetical protein